MRKLHGAWTCLLFIIETLAVLCALTQPAYAYVDPGSGLLAFQIISTTFAGMLFLLRRRVRRLIGYISGHSRSKGEKESKQ
jgi:hypothetical protein